MSSLVQRLLTAAALIPVVVWVVLFSPEYIFVAVLSVIVFIAGYEWAGLSNLNKKQYKYAFAISVLVIAYFFTLFNDQILNVTMMASMLGWLLFVVLVITKPSCLLHVKISRWLMVVVGALVVALVFSSLHYLRLNYQQGPELLMYLLLLIWIADSGAYFVGRSFGKRKLSPLISPGKSIEGVVGGMFTCLIFAVFGALYFAVDASLPFVLMSLFVAFISVYGDLFESLIKRRANVKDSGNILPGHGGVLDRIDSLIAAGPVFLGCLLLNGMFA